MHDYDLGKIAEQVKKSYKETKMWPSYVELPQTAFDKLTQGQSATEIHTTVLLPPSHSCDGVMTHLYYRPGNVDKPVMRWYRGIENADVLKDKPQPPNLHVKSTCSSCIMATAHNQSYIPTQIRCQKYEVNLSGDNYCDDWSKRHDRI
jgi:hypothetical protein